MLSSFLSKALRARRNFSLLFFIDFLNERIFNDDEMMMIFMKVNILLYHKLWDDSGATPVRIRGKKNASTKEKNIVYLYHLLPKHFKS